jgi:predicted aldo/keto reductase-like oxidoreductase
LTKRYGIEFFDTAEGYGGGSSEERLRDMVEWGDEPKVGDLLQSTSHILNREVYNVFW